MQKLNPKSDGRTIDFVAENIDKMKQMFPEIITEDGINFDTLRELLGDYVDDHEERYEFKWHGKSRARWIAQTPSMGTLRPSTKESVNWDDTQNLFIEGDNLEALKLLQKSYHKKVKMIYIDPPYNTGRDFIYPDNFNDNIHNYLKITGQMDNEGRKISPNSEMSGRYHTNWLNMMYPRLRLAKNLLRDDGVIFISIGENELNNLTMVCNQIFGEENLLGIACRVAKKSNNKGDFWAPNFDYILTYAKLRELTPSFFGGINEKAYDQVDTEGPRKGEKYQLVRFYMSTIQNRNPEQRFWIDCPDGSKVIPPGSTFPPEKPNLGDGIWRWTRSKFEAEKDKIVVKKVRSSNLINENKEPAKWNVYTKTYLNDVIENATAKPNSLVENYINQMGSHELDKLGIPFSYPKPSALIKFLLSICKTEKNDIILDFFAGSCTTAHAVLDLNKEENGNRKFIMVQLPEPCDENSEAYKAGYETIADIGKERIRRVANKIKEENPEYQGDLGFKVFKLDSTNIKPWEIDADNLQSSLEDYVSNIKDGRSEEDVLYEILIKYGLDLTLPIEERVIQGRKVFVIGYGALVICLDDDITLETVEGIAELKDELQPEVMRIVFKDNGFKDDVVKTNAVQILGQSGIEDVKSL